jgi:hypothetical protein
MSDRATIAADRPADVDETLDAMPLNVGDVSRRA